MLTYILLVLCHYFIELLFIIGDAFDSLCHMVRSTTTCLNNIRAIEINEHRLHLSKIPNHLSFVIVEKDISLSGVVNLIKWSAAIGIPHVSFYDHAGLLKKKKVELEQEILSSCHSKELPNYHIDFHEKKYDYENKYNGIHETNGFSKHLKKISVCLLSEEDGRYDIVRTAKYLCKAVNCEAILPENLTQNTFSSYLNAASGFPDPDLLIRCGKIETLLGFLPWQIRLTEMLSLPSHKNVKLDNFFQILERYSNCEKRWGK